MMLVDMFSASVSLSVIIFLLFGIPVAQIVIYFIANIVISVLVSNSVSVLNSD